MRAIVFYRHGDPGVLQYRDDIPVPRPATGEVVLRVRYAGLNRLDDFVRAGWRGLDLAFPHILGSDVSGEIAAIGEQVHGWDIGQRVVANPTLWCGECPACVAGWHNRCDRFAILGEHIPGAYAEYVRVPARNLMAVPDASGDELAAAAPLAAVTAWHMLITVGRVRPGETVLVVGSGGGVNLMAVQIARLAGATVLAIASTPTKAEKIQSLGANWVVNRSDEPDWSRRVWSWTGKRGVDVVVDNVGAATWVHSLRTLAKGGRLLTVGGTSGYEVVTPISLLFGRQLSVIGTSMGTQTDFEAVMGQVWAGRLHPIVDSVYDLEDYPAALSRMLSGEGFGKILVKIA